MNPELNKVEAILAGIPFADDLADVDLGHRARERRAQAVLQALRQHPDRGFPKVFGEGDCDRFYEFLSSEQVSASELLEAHTRKTTMRSIAAGEVLIVHDSSEFEWNRSQPIVGMTDFGKRGYGFLGHFSIAVSADVRVCYGVLGIETIVREEKKSKVKWRVRYDDPTKESLRWFRGVEESEGLLPESVEAIHVMDREGDIFELFAHMVERGQRFVIRMRKDRLVVAEKGSQLTVMRSLREVPALARREVDLSKRREPLPAAARRHPAREKRIATLEIAACPVAILRPSGLDSKLPKSLPINVVHVWEPEPPVGEEPISWVLFTTEPIDSPEQVLKIVDFYRARWVIEEFFKALKTGCLLEKRQLESARAIANVLALFVPIACEMLALRALARIAPDALASEFIDEEKIEVLRVISKRKLPERLTVHAFYLAVAALAGHLKRNGEPGWKLLGEGYRELLKAQALWKKAKAFFQGASSLGPGLG